jgi:hypothetical protein
MYMNSMYVLYVLTVYTVQYAQFLAYKMTVPSENLMLKHSNVDLNTVSLNASDCTVHYILMYAI